MHLNLTPEQEARLIDVAQHEGRNPEQLVMDATFGLLGNDTLMRETLRERTGAADGGVFLEEDEMHARIQAMLQH